MSYMNGLSAAKNPNSEFGYRQQLYTCARKLIQSLIGFDKQFLQSGGLTKRSRASGGAGRFLWQIHGLSPIQEFGSVKTRELFKNAHLAQSKVQ
jgi:hypothetical protein